MVLQCLAYGCATLSFQLRAAVRCFPIGYPVEPAAERSIIEKGRIALRIVTCANESAELIRHCRRVGWSETRDAQPDVIAFHLDVVLDTGKPRDLIAAANETFG